MIEQQLIPAAISYYQSALKVDRLTKPLAFAPSVASRCGNIIPPEDLADGIDADLVIFVIAAEGNGEALASASSCVLHSETKR
jgi:hypothetical protein